MVGSSVYAMLQGWIVLWGAFLVWPIGTVPVVAYATDLTARNEAVSATGPVVVGRVMYRGPVPAPIEVPVDRDIEVCGHVMTLTTLSVDAATRGVREIRVLGEDDAALRARAGEALVRPAFPEGAGAGSGDPQRFPFLSVFEPAASA